MAWPHNMRTDIAARAAIVVSAAVAVIGYLMAKSYGNECTHPMSTIRECLQSMVVIVTDNGVTDPDYPSGYSVVPSGLQYSELLSACIAVAAVAMIILIVGRGSRRA